MIRKEDFIHSIGGPDEGFNRAMNAALLHIQEEERKPVMKRKLTMTLAAAIIAALALTGAALALGMNLFEYFGKYEERLNRLAPQSELKTAEPETVKSESLGTTKATFKNGYYDGQSLLAAFTMENSERYEAFVPTEEMLARMEKVDEDYRAASYDENSPGAEAVEDFLIAVYNGNPCGYVHYSVYPSDHCFANGVDLPPWQEYYETMENGNTIYLREFENPLPEAVQNQDRLELRLKLWQMPSYVYFDGNDWYELYEKAQPAGEITAVIPRTDAVMRRFIGESEYNEIPISIETRVSAVRAEVKIAAEGKVFPYPGTDRWYDALLMDESGRVLRSESVSFEGNNAEITFNGTGALPEKLTLYVGVDGEGEWQEESFKENAKRIELTMEK